MLFKYCKSADFMSSKRLSSLLLLLVVCFMTSCKSEEDKMKEVAQQKVNDFLVAVSQNDTAAIDSIYPDYLLLYHFDDKIHPNKLTLKSIDYYDLSKVANINDSIKNYTKKEKLIYEMYGKGKYCELNYSGERKCRFIVKHEDDKITLHSFGFFKNKTNTLESSKSRYTSDIVSTKWAIKALTSDEATATLVKCTDSALMEFMILTAEGLMNNNLSNINKLCPSTSKIKNYSVPAFVVTSSEWVIDGDKEGLFYIAGTFYDSLKTYLKTYKLYFDAKDFAISKASNGSLYVPSNNNISKYQVQAYASEGFLYYNDELDKINSRSLINYSENYFEGKTDAEIRLSLNNMKKELDEMDRLREEEARKSAARAKYEKVGLVITDVDVSHGTNRYGESTTGLKFEIFNPTKKTIKYVIAIVQGINKFEDPVTQRTKLRGMGPIDPYSSGSWDFSDAFDDKNGIIDDLRGSFQVIYTDGSSRTVSLSAGYADSNFSPSLWR